jgi:protein-S-isoprenylcysteine O-methyltransferase Ste14
MAAACVSAMNLPTDGTRAFHGQLRLVDRIEQQGGWLFHRRDVFAVVFLPLLVLALWFPGFPGDALRDAGFDHLGEVGLGVSMAGLVLRWFVVGSATADTSGRSTRELRAAKLNTTGLYSLVRHPLYLANAVVVAGFVASTASLWLLAVFFVAYALYIERIAAAEERYLESVHGDAWRAWVARTPAFVPDFAQWRPTGMRFSVRTVMRREYNGLFGVSLAYFTLEAVRDLGVAHESLHAWLLDDDLWPILLLAGVAVLLLLRTLKRHTRHLHVSGR